MDQRHKDVIEDGNALFGKKGPLNSLWQELAENFYVERADFTASRSLGAEFGTNLTTSYPLMVRRELGNTIGAMMRPANQDWFFMRAMHEDIEVQDAKIWMEWASGTMRRALYDRKSGFAKATSQGDHDYVTFGQAVLTPELSPDRSRLLIRTWHLRDNAWTEGYDGHVNTIHRNWTTNVADLYRTFGDKIAQTLKEKIEQKEQGIWQKEIHCRHIVLPTDNYDLEKKVRNKFPFVSIYIDLDNEHVMEERPVPAFGYIVPRWQTVSGSQYAYSPATVCALPDARLMQAMTLSLLEAGEKAVNPPMIGVRDRLRSDVNVLAGGITWADLQGDAELKDALTPLGLDFRGIPEGVAMREDLRETLKEAFYLNKLNLPPMGGPEMTAFEVGQRVQEFIRNAVPLFAPIEPEYNGALCEEVFGLMLREGGFGPVQNIPQSLQGQEIQFKFASPITQAEGTQKIGQFQQTAQMIAAAASLDPHIGSNVDAQTAFRDALDGAGIPAKWLRDEKAVAAIQQQQAAQAQAAALLADVGHGAMVAKNVGDAGQSLKDSGLLDAAA